MTDPSPISHKLRRNLLLFAASASIAALGVFFVWRTNPDIDYWIGLIKIGQEFVESHPWTLILMLATLPGLGFPLSPILILTGILLAPQFGLPLTCLMGITALAFCTIWTYAVAAGPMRHILKNIILKKYKFPELHGKNALRVALILRITPGIPYPLQNFGLGVMGIDFKTYLIASIPVQSLYAIAFIVTGGAIFQGKAGAAITGGILLVALILAARIFTQRTQTNA